MNRREFLISGGVTLSLGSILAACGATVASAPGRVGIASTIPSITAPKVDDALVLRTLQSLHHSANEMFTKLIDADMLDSALIPVVEQLMADHTAAAATIGELVTASGGTPFACANPFVVQRYIDDPIAKTAGSDDLQRDGGQLAMAFEEYVARSHQAMATMLTELPPRASVIQVGTAMTANSVMLSLAAGQPVIDPILLGEAAVETDEDNFPIRYALPSSFGQVGAVPVTVGAIDPDEGTRYSTTYQTPSENSYIAPDTECSSSN